MLQKKSKGRMRTDIYRLSLSTTLSLSLPHLVCRLILTVFAFMKFSQIIQFSFYRNSFFSH